MTRDEARGIIQRGLGFRTDRADDIVSAMQQAQRLFEQGKTLPWFFIQEDQEITLAADASTASIPEGFIREIERNQGMRFIPSGGTTYRWITKAWYDELQDVHRTTETGEPSYYVIRKSTFLFDRPASAATTLYWDFYKKAEVLTSNVENAWLANAPDLLIGAGGEIIARDLRDDRALAKFQELRMAAWDAVIRENAMREVANREIVLGRNS
jgi:hypothetical protein